MHPVTELFYQKRDVAVIGGGNSALDDALLLSEICNKVYLIHRRAEFRGDASTLENWSKRKCRNHSKCESTGNRR